MSDAKRVVAKLYGGPFDQVKLWVEPDPSWSSPWPGYTCVTPLKGMPMHYKLLGSGVYEFAGACREFDHDPEKHQQRCADCGSEILEGSHSHQAR